MFKNEKGFTGIEITITVILIFIFVGIISTLIYNLNSTSREIELEAEALNIAIEEIEKIKNEEFSKYLNLYNYKSEIKEINGKKGFFEIIEVQDLNETAGNEGKIGNLIKKIKVKISYKFKNNTKTIELSTVKSKEN